MTKAVVGEGDQLRTGPRWMTSRRGILRLYPDRLTCGNWTIPYETIRAAELARFRTPILRIPGYLLSVRTDERTYHFGLNGWRYWEGELPFAVVRRDAKLRMSLVSIVARAIVIGYVGYWIWLRLRS